MDLWAIAKRTGDNHLATIAGSQMPVTQSWANQIATCPFLPASLAPFRTPDLDPQAAVEIGTMSAHDSLPDGSSIPPARDQDAIGDTNPSEVADAQTVIRDSSRGALSGSNPPARTPAAVAKVLLGQRLNHFQLNELIGGGGMGAVFRAHDEQLDRVVAIKVVPFVGDDADLARRFRNEAQSAAKLDHPGIARVYDVGNQDQWHYIVFEYVEGTNVRELVSSDGVLSD